MISYLGSLVQFSPAAGRAGRCRQKSLCVGSTRRVLAKQPAVLGTTPRVLRTFSLRCERLGWPEVCARSPRVQSAFSFRDEWPRQPEAWCPLDGHAAPFPSMTSGPGSQRLGALSTGTPRLFPPRHRSGLMKSLDRNRGLFAGWEGVASLGLNFPLSPPPTSYLQWGWGGSSLEFLSPFVLGTAGGVFQPVNFSLALPQFKKISLRLLSGPSGRSLP